MNGYEVNTNIVSIVDIQRMYTLHLYVPEQYLNVYTTHVERWLEQQNDRGQYFDAGFDLLLLEPVEGSCWNTVKVNHKVAAKMVYQSGATETPVCYYMYPRSSLSKTRFRLANSVGIIDAGYRGHLIAKVDTMPYNDLDMHLSSNKCYFQLCAPDLGRITNVVIHSESELNNEVTSRGTGGFGSTS